ncbi:hypothetical protein PRIPAC_84218 [Pristionchus pacificus]|uniref:Uncharacterized protein n=1 Tax=Pristionchus pacificus TaxID=54126 RepID=A0A2A6C4U7_PRIPA|nr:hypothetical protein PRIPAC_84218 [Pristionchus pacificus]|eukprot:PDM73159.1 hypothetical protein PRIPAC_43255 [Pristionchus pacificus]
MATISSKPHSDISRWVVVYPCYLNNKKSTGEGRKISKQLAVADPTVEEILMIVNNGGFKVAAERKLHPRDPERDNGLLMGRIRVQLKNDDGTPVNAEVPNRMALFRYIAGLIPKLKTRTGAAVGGAAVAPSASAGGKKNKKKK